MGNGSVQLHENGEDYLVGSFKDGKPDGIAKFYDENGKPHTRNYTSWSNYTAVYDT